MLNKVALPLMSLFLQTGCSKEFFKNRTNPVKNSVGKSQEGFHPFTPGTPLSLSIGYARINFDANAFDSNVRIELEELPANAPSAEGFSPLHTHVRLRYYESNTLGPVVPKTQGLVDFDLPYSIVAKTDPSPRIVVFKTSYLTDFLLSDSLELAEGIDRTTLSFALPKTSEAEFFAVLATPDLRSSNPTLDARLSKLEMDANHLKVEPILSLATLAVPYNLEKNLIKVSMADSDPYFDRVNIQYECKVYALDAVSGEIPFKACPKVSSERALWVDAGEEGTRSIEIRAKVDTYRSPSTKRSVYLHQSLSDALACKELMSNQDLVNRAAQDENLASVHRFRAANHQLNNPFVRIGFAAADLDVRTLRKSFSIVKSADQEFLVVRRTYPSRFHANQCHLSLRVGRGNERNIHNCEALVINPTGKGACFGSDGSKIAVFNNYLAKASSKNLRLFSAKSKSAANNDSGDRMDFLVLPK